MVATAPSLFSASSNGKVIAAGLFVRRRGDGTTVQGLTFDAATGSGVSIELGPDGAQVFIVLFGTGIRNAQLVTAIIGGVGVSVAFAGPRGEFAGLDQINGGSIPKTLLAAGQTEILLDADGNHNNSVAVILH